MATLCRLDVFLLFTFLNIISNSRSYLYPDASRVGHLSAASSRGKKMQLNLYHKVFGKKHLASYTR